MTLTDQSTGRLSPEMFQQEEIEALPSGQDVNVGDSERLVSIAAGSIAALLGLGRGGVPGLLIAAVGGGLIYRGATGKCHVYKSLDINTAQDSQRGIHIEQAMLINRSPQELYDYWRNYENLPRIMSHLIFVEDRGNGHSHWVAEAPKIAGGQVEWDASTTRDEPGAAIAWRSLPGSDVDTAGEVRFSPALGDRGTEVHVTMKYRPPAGKLGHWVASLLAENPYYTIREDLRNFKRIMETGEIPTIEGQPRGSCTMFGGKREQSRA